MPTSNAATIVSFRSTLDAQTLAIVDALRALISATNKDLQEEFKWNAPSFRLGKEHRVTLGLERKGGVRVVLHRGAFKKDTIDFSFDDPDKLAVWPSKDRGVLIMESMSDVDEKRDQLTVLISRWLQIPA